jgi:hypothetical protein
MTAGCGESLRLDGSSEENLRDSIESAKARLSTEDRLEFEDALKVLVFGDVKSLLDLAAVDPDSMQRRIRDKLDGKTIHEIISDAEEIRSSRRAEQRGQIAGEIEELREKEAAADRARQKLDAFVVQRSRFYYDESGYRRTPIIEITVRNGTDVPVSRAYFHGVLATPGRSVPWVEGDFNYEISGGLEPGETATWSLALDKFSDWGKAPVARDDMVITVEANRIDGPDGEAALDARFTKRDTRRLEALRSQVAEPPRE